MSHCQACNKTVEQTEKDVQLEKLFAKYRGQKGALIPVLQKAQDIYGYLPKEVLEKISSELKLPPAKVYGVVTFYSQFHLEPRGKYVIRVCQGTACHVRGASKIFEELQNLLQIKDGETTKDLKFTLESIAKILAQYE